MKTARAALAFAVLVLLLGPMPARAFKRTEVGEPLKDFALDSLAGGPLRLSEHRGSRATLLVFWATWSPRSAEVLRDFEQLYRAHRGGGLQVVAVNVEHQEWDPGDMPRLEQFVRDLGVSFPVLFDKDLAVFSSYGVIAVPSSVLAGPDGTILELLEGYANMTRGAFQDRVLREIGALAPEPVKREEPVGYRPKGKAERFVQMGRVLLERGMPARAEKAFRQALEEDPEWPEARQALAEALEAQEEAGHATGRRGSATGGEAKP
jgi:peroxiredoxin